MTAALEETVLRQLTDAVFLSRYDKRTPVEPLFGFCLSQCAEET